MKPRQADPGSCGSEQGMGWASVATTGPLLPLNLLGGPGNQTVAVLVKASVAGASLFTGAHAGHQLGERSQILF